MSVKAVADSKINTDEVLKTIAGKVRTVSDPPRPRSPAVKRGSPIPFSRFSRRVSSAPRASLTLPRPPRPPIGAVGGHREQVCRRHHVAGAAGIVWLSGTVVGANSIPVLPKVMELVGLGYSSWFVYRYVLFKDSRKELVEQFDALKNKVSGEF